MDKKQIKIGGGIGGSLIISDNSIIIPHLFNQEIIPYTEIEKIEYVQPRGIHLGEVNIYFKDTELTKKTVRFSRYDNPIKFEEAVNFVEKRIGKNGEKNLALASEDTSLDMLINNINFYDNINKEFYVKYLTGVPVYKEPDNCRVFIEENGLRFKKIFSPEAKIQWTTIEKISAENRTQITRGVATGKAAIGLLLAGPIGALIGASIGTKRDDTVCFISVSYKNELQEEAVLLLQSDKAFEIATVMSEARKGYFIKYGIKQKKIEETTTKTVDNLDQLEKLASLKDKGIITQEEFDAKKKQLLGL